MKLKFTKKIAREIAQISFNYVLDSVIGYSDPDYTLGNEGEEFEQNFEEDMLKRNIVVNNVRLASVAKEFDKIREKAIKLLEKKISYRTQPLATIK